MSGWEDEIARLRAELKAAIERAAQAEDLLGSHIRAGLRLEAERDAARGALATVLVLHDDPYGENPSCRMTSAIYERIKLLLREGRSGRRAADPPPRYDEVFREGMRWLDGLAGPEDESQP